MMPNLETIKTFCYLNDEETQLLLSFQRPIVILNRKPNSPISPNISPNQSTLGAMLPYTPLHYLLFYNPNSSADDILASPPIFSALVMTSGNLSEEPIAFTNEQASTKLKDIADGFLLHNRAINIRCDDSVTRIASFSTKSRRTKNISEHVTFIPIRRSRGYAPDPIKIFAEIPQILAVGAELKNTFCLTREKYAFVSHHIGDLKNFETYKAFENSIEHYKKLFRINPKIISHDMHPDYLSTSYALDKVNNEGYQAIPVQHHHAHIVSCMAEHRLPPDDKVIGIAFDGTGYGEDKAIWGGEVFIANYKEYTRLFHLDYAQLIGGDKAVQEPWRMALSWLYKAGIPWVDELNPIKYL
jgi:hydrogenase maturation protein HypF